MGRTRRLLLAVVLVAGCHAVLPLSTSSDGISEDKAGPDLPMAVDLARPSDLPRDASFDRGDLARDATSDASQYLCEKAQPVNTMQSDTGVKLSLIEPALMYDGKTLLAREDETVNHWVSTRPGPTGAFGPWKKWSGLPGDWEDPSFFRRNQIDYVIVARSVRGASRYLEHCDLAGTCDKLSFTGISAGLDLDGPDIRAGVGGKEELVFAGGGELYIASATGPKGPWTAAPTSKLNLANVNDDDPAISADGLWLVFGSNRAGSMDLFLAGRLPGKSFDLVLFPLQVAFGLSVNSPREDAAPDLAPMASGVGIELFFHSDRGESGGPGPFTIYRASCELK
jgi:hypothetical protein